jgi:cysteine desulfurase/selenocysteine lyase
MTTPPPIADEFGPASFGGADGLPDEATINRWAAAFWSPDPGFYFLNSASTYTAAAPAHPSVGEAWLPSLGLLSTHAPAPQAGAPAPSGFYFINEAIPAGFEVPNLPLDPHPAFDVHAVRRDFPILSETVHGRPLIWLDNAATTQKPQAVIDRLAYFYAHENSNIHRSAHAMAARATDAYESARSTVARFLGAGSADEIVFVRGATEGINLVAKAWGFRHIKAGDEIVISHLEHHANIVPWQMLAERVGASIKVIPVDDSGQILLDAYTDLLSDRTKIVAITQVSNALGTIVPVERVIELAHRVGARVLVDGAQSVPHTPLDLQSMGADFFVFSGHKVFGPTGIGAVYGTPEALEEMPPWQGGGNMITDVTLERAQYQPPPGRFEAGTGNLADAVGLAAALDYVERIGMPNIAAYEHALLEYAQPKLAEVPGLHLIGTAAEKASVMSFVLDGHDPEDVGKALDAEGIAVRSGHHCAQPILRRFGLEATVRPSLAFYNTCDEVDTLIAALRRFTARSYRS